MIMKLKTLFAIILVTLLSTVAKAQDRFLRLSYTNATLTVTSQGVSLSGDMKGVSIDGGRTIDLRSPYPIYLDLDITYSLMGSDDTFLMSGALAPSLMWRFINGPFEVAPYAGLNLTVHGIGQTTIHGQTYDLFDDDSEYGIFNQIMIGTQMGVRVRYSKIFLQVSINPYLSKFGPYTKMHLFNIGLGYAF